MEWSEPGPPCSINRVGFSRMTGPSGTNLLPSTSKNRRPPFTDTCMARSLHVDERSTQPRHLLVWQPALNHTARFQGPVTIPAYSVPHLIPACRGKFRRQDNMSPRLHMTYRAVAAAAVLAVTSQAFAPKALAQDADLEMRIQRLENQLRQITGQNEELQYRNRQLEERLRQLGAAPPAAPGAPPEAAQQGVAAMPSAQANPPYRQPAYPQQGGYQQPQAGYQQPPTQQQGGYEQPQIAAPAPIMQEPASPGMGNRRRGDAFDPTQNPNAPGAPRALGGGQMPINNQAAVGAPGGRAPGEPLDLGATSPRAPGGALPPASGSTAALTTLPPSATPRDQFDL